MLFQQDGIKCQPNGKHGAIDAYFWCQGLDKCHASMRGNVGLKISEIEEHHSYGMREFSVYDPDGYKLVFAEDMTKEWKVSIPYKQSVEGHIFEVPTLSYRLKFAVQSSRDGAIDGVTDTDGLAASERNILGFPLRPLVVQDGVNIRPQ